MNKYFEYRIYPNEQQSELIKKTIGCARLVYNLILNDNNNFYKENEKFKFNSPALYKDEYPFLKEVDSDALGQAYMNCRKAFSKFFKTKKGFPKFKSKKTTKKTYTSLNRNGTIRFQDGKLKLPKLGLVSGVWHRHCEGKIKQATVKMNPNGKFFVSILTEFEPKIKEINVPENKKILGIDMSMSNFGVTSEEEKINPPKWVDESARRLAMYQRKFTKMQKGSKRWEKQRIKIANVYERVTNQKKDWLNNLSLKLVKQYDVIVVEDINLQTMARRFGKSISQNSFGLFRQMLEYKAKDRLKEFIKADKFYPSTQLCSSCGFKNKEVAGLSNLGIKEWTCPSCGEKHDRDINASKNLVNYYLKKENANATLVSARGDSVSLETSNQAVVDESRKIEREEFNYSLSFKPSALAVGS